MGNFGSSEENLDQKVVDITGQVNNNIVIQEAKDTHEQVKINERMITTMYLMCIIEMIKLGVYIYHRFKKSLKKKYNQNGNHQNAN